MERTQWNSLLRCDPTARGVPSVLSKCGTSRVARRRFQSKGHATSRTSYRDIYTNTICAHPAKLLWPQLLLPTTSHGLQTPHFWQRWARVKEEAELTAGGKPSCAVGTRLYEAKS